MNIATLEQDLRTYRPAGMEGLPEEFVWPRYEGLSVGNVPATVGELLGARTSGILPPLRSDLLEGLTDGVRTVVAVLLDALGWVQLRQWMADDESLVFHELAEKGRLLPLTSVFPSTTNNVLATLRTGVPPVRHGLLAYELYLRELYTAAECITFSPLAHKSPGLLETWGLEPDTFLPVPPLAHLFSVQGILTYYLIAKHISYGPLSRMYFRGSREVYTHSFASDFWYTLREVLHAHHDERTFISAYWSGVDTLAHEHGPQHGTLPNEVHALSYLMKHSFLERLTPEDREGTLLLILADHGQIPVYPETSILLDDHPQLRDALVLPPLGEARTPFFHVRAGHLEEVRAYLEANFGGEMALLDRQMVLESGLLGPGEPYEEVYHRLGDLVGLMRDRYVIVRDAEIIGRLNGRHGGVVPEEMLVPLLAVRLDA